MRTVFQWKSSHIAKSSLESPTGHGWSWDDETRSYTPMMTTLNPAPESVVELSMRKRTTGCSTLRWKCKKVTLCVQICVSVRTATTQLLI